MITLSEQSPRPQETFRYYFEQLQDLAREATRPEQRGRLLATAAAGGSDLDGITIEVRRVGGSDGAVKLAYGTRNGSARAGREFRRTEGELRWSTATLRRARSGFRYSRTRPAMPRATSASSSSR